MSGIVSSGNPFNSIDLRAIEACTGGTTKHFFDAFRAYHNLSEPVDEKALKVFQQVFSDPGPFTPLIRKIIRDYIPDETSMILYKSQVYPDHCVRPFQKRVELFPSATLKPLFDKNCCSKEHLSSATNLAKSIYGQGQRPVGLLKFGYTYSMNPEVLEYMMRIIQSLSSKKIQVMELGAADGKNAILLAYTKATKVIVNDLCTKEKALFLKHTETLPSNVRKKLQFIDKDCLKILEKRKVFEGSMDLVFSRNLFHFFSTHEQKKYLELTLKLLKKDGFAVISANAKYPFFRKYQNIFAKHPNHNCFTLTQCLVTDIANDDSYPIFHKIEYCPESAFSNEIEQYEILTRSKKTNFRWEFNQKKFDSIDSDLRAKVKKVYDKKKEKISKIKNGCVTVLIQKIHCFTEENLASLFHRNHFKVITTAVLGEDGHLVEEDWMEEQGKQVLIVVKKT